MVWGKKPCETIILKPQQATTDSFLDIGTFSTQCEAVALQKYLRTKFTCALLGTKKITQNNTRGVFSNIPLQDFTENSDINWDKTISEIDQQLYKKYNLNDTEVKFIEEHVKPMK